MKSDRNVKRSWKFNLVFWRPSMTSKYHSKEMYQNKGPTCGACSNRWFTSLNMQICGVLVYPHALSLRKRCSRRELWHFQNSAQFSPDRYSRINQESLARIITFSSLHYLEVPVDFLISPPILFPHQISLECQMRGKTANDSKLLPFRLKINFVWKDAFEVIFRVELI